MASGKDRNGISILSQVLLVLCLGGFIALLQKPRLQEIVSPQTDTLATQAEVQQRREELRLTLLKNMPDLGFRNLIANWTFLNFLQYFGNEEHRNVTGYRLSGDYFEVIIGKDPFYYPFYLFLSSSVSLFAGQPERTVALQEKGLQSLSPTFPPKAYFIWRHKSIDELLFLRDTAAALRSQEKAVEWAAQSPDPEAKVRLPFFQQTAEFLATDPDNTQVQIGAWAQILATAPDDKTRAVAIENIEALGGQFVQNEDGSYSIRSDSSNPNASN